MQKQKFISYVVLVVLGIIFIVPFIIMVMASFKEMRAGLLDPISLLPTDPSLVNFNFIFSQGLFFRWIFNSFVITVIPVLSQMLLGAVMGYIFAKKQFWGKEFIFWSMMIFIMLPQQLLIIPKYIMFSDFGWINTYWALIVPELWGILGVFLVRQFFQTIPDDYEEAAYMDGGNDFQIFFKIMIPMAFPVIATVGTFTFIQLWNDLFQPLVYMTEEAMFPITVGLASLLTEQGDFGVDMAGAVISFIPTFLVFLFFQRYFTEGIQMSGLK